MIVIKIKNRLLDLYVKAVKTIKNDGTVFFIKKLFNYLYNKFNFINKLDSYFFYGANKWRFIKPYMLNRFFYYMLRLFRFREGEHQIGRLINIERIFKEISRRGLQGDIVEFGSYQGYSLKWLIYFRDKYKLTKNIIGVDAFEGLPISSTIWKKGEFSDTSKQILINNIKKSLKIDDLEKNFIFVIQGYFDDSIVRERINKITKKILIAHIDCDLGFSCDQVLDIVGTSNLNEEYYLLFDDWGCHQDEIPKSFSRFVSTKRIDNYKEISETIFTKNFIVGATNGQ